MGNFSRDPNARLADSVIKHYVGVRMQQGVPLVDADWNELEDLRRREQETFGSWFMGNGVPSGNDGYHIISVAPQPNDFGIVQGVCLVNGKLVENALNVRYTTQPNFGNPKLEVPLPPLTNPGTTKQFIAYLDVWERDVDSEEDPVLVDAKIGVETALRVKREWAVRVGRVPEDLTVIQNPPPGHIFYPLARLNRKNNNQITVDMIEDLRDTQVSVLRRIEVRDNIGQIVLDNARFRTVLTNTRNNVHAFINFILTQFNRPTNHMQAAELLGIQSGEHIASTAEIGLALLSSDSIANRGALGILAQLYYAENNFMVTWRDFVLQLGTTPKTYASYVNFITRLNERLNQPSVGILTGLQAALTAGNLEAATTTQEDIARLFGAASASIARGMIQVILAQSPGGNLSSPPTQRFVFKVKSFTTKADTYTVKILPEGPGLWPRRVVDSIGVPIPQSKVSLGPGGSETTILVDVDVQPGTSGLQLRVTSDSNPDEINQLGTQFILTQGQPAPVGEDKIQFRLEFNAPDAGTAVLDLHTGIISIRRSTEGAIQLRLFNNTGVNTAFNIAIEKQEQLGAWNVTFDIGAPPRNTGVINNGLTAPLIALVTPGADATSMNLLITAKATISGVEVKGQTTLSLTARTS